MREFKIKFKDNSNELPQITFIKAKNEDQAEERFLRIMPAVAIISTSPVMTDVYELFKKHKPRLIEVSKEILRQDIKWGENRHHHPFVWLTILGEEVGEINRAVLEMEFNAADSCNYREEIIQVAAVCMQMLLDLDVNPNEYPKCEQQ